MKLTFVLPVHNEQCNVAIALRHLIRQSVPAEIIVIDDGSTDATIRIVKEIIKDAPEDKKIIFIENPKRIGAAACRNMGNKLAEGDIIAVCDAEIYYKDRGKAILEFFESFPDKGFFYSALHLKSAETHEDIGEMPAIEWDFKSKCPISHPSVAYRKSVAMQFPYHEASLETDLFEFMALDAHRGGVLFGGCQNPLLCKLEGNSNRDMMESKIVKQLKYEEYGIEVSL
jgi:glycosyltransferase involved in cell wall biosynthesis